MIPLENANVLLYIYIYHSQLSNTSV